MDLSSGLKMQAVYFDPSSIPADELGLRTAIMGTILSVADLDHTARGPDYEALLQALRRAYERTSTEFSQRNTL